MKVVTKIRQQRRYWLERWGKITGKKNCQRENGNIKRDESENKQAKGSESQDKDNRAVNERKWVKVNERSKQNT